MRSHYAACKERKAGDKWKRYEFERLYRIPNKSFQMNAARILLTGVILLRASYAIWLFLSVFLVYLGFPEVFPISGHFLDFARSLSWVFLMFWGLYVLGYAIAGVFTAFSSRYGLWVYVLAMMVDFSMWIYTTTSPHYEVLWSGTAPGIDMVFNLLDFTILISLAMLTYFRVLR